MEYRKTVVLKDGRTCILRSGTERDGQGLLTLYIRTHEQTDYLSSYPDESSLTAEEEAAFLKEKAESPDEIELLAELDGNLAGIAGISRVGRREKVRHRAMFGISVDRDFWGLGIGRALTEACIECAAKAGYEQVELNAVAENTKALALYRSVGFVEFGRNPKGFRSRYTGWQETVQMLLDLSRAVPGTADGNETPAEDGIRIRRERISAEEYIAFLKRTDLGSQYPRERFAERIARLSDSVSISLTARTGNGLLVGVLFALSDFAYWLYVTDLGVDRQYERRGIGRRLLKTAHEAAGGEKDIAVYLVANENAVPFYEKCGMRKADDVMQYNHIEWTPFTVR